MASKEHICEIEPGFYLSRGLQSSDAVESRGVQLVVILQSADTHGAPSLPSLAVADKVIACIIDDTGDGDQKLAELVLPQLVVYHGDRARPVMVCGIDDVAHEIALSLAVVYLMSRHGGDANAVQDRLRPPVQPCSTPRALRVIQHFTEKAGFTYWSNATGDVACVIS